MSRKQQIIRFLSIFAVILAAMHFYLFERISYYLELNLHERIGLGYALGMLTILTLAAIPLTRALPPKYGTAISWIIYPWMGIGLILFSIFVITDILWLSYRLFVSTTVTESSFIQQKLFGIATIAVAFSLSVYALWNGLRVASIRHVDVHLKKLPQPLDGLSVVQISDLHIGPMLKGGWLQKIVDKVNALDPDVIAITGDLVDGSVAELGKYMRILGGLRAKEGIYFVTGNHEYYSGVSDWCSYIERLGITVLRNQRADLNIGGSKIEVAGVDDISSQYFPGEGHDLAKALAGRDVSVPVILLAHQPKSMHQAKTMGVDLQLSGHTHGGQIWPFSYLVYLQQPFSHGLYRDPAEDFQMYVSAGTGFWGPPMRLGTTSEITCLTMRCG